jgi:hypothetical protein
MIRQCAWCLRLMNQQGEWVSLQPVPKVYEATHGMCRICGIRWLEQVLVDTEKQLALSPVPVVKENDYYC